MNKRRLFLNQLSLMAGAAVLSNPIAAAASLSKKLNSVNSAGKNVTVYHTNDLHGNIDPAVSNAGGLNQVKKLIDREDVNGLLFDAGGFLNSAHSPAQQKDMIYAMNNMGYIAATLGNHELCHGEEALARLVPLMKFELVNCNYQFNGELNKLVKPYTIVYSGKYKIGITGVGHQIKGVKYNDAIQSANYTARILKEQEKCDLVICLAHLGHTQEDDLPDNQKLAKQSAHIDLIIGGHNQKLLVGPVIKLNKLKQEVIISQAAWDGLMMGKVVFSFENNKQKSYIRGKNCIAGDLCPQTQGASFNDLRAIEKLLVSA